MSDDPIDLAAIRKARALRPMLISRPRDYSECKRHHSIISYEKRTVTCRDCNVALDPIQVLRNLASTGDDFVRVTRETKRLRAEANELATEVKRLKDQVRRWRKKAERPNE